MRNVIVLVHRMRSHGGPSAVHQVITTENVDPADTDDALLHYSQSKGTCRSSSTETVSCIIQSVVGFAVRDKQCANNYSVRIMTGGLYRLISIM